MADRPVRVREKNPLSIWDLVTRCSSDLALPGGGGSGSVVGDGVFEIGITVA